MINMKHILPSLSLAFILACAGKGLGPEPHTRDEIIRDLSSLPVLYIAEDGRKREAPGGQACFVDQVSRKIFWMALECRNSKCPAKVESGKPHIFIMPDPGVFVNKKGELGFDPKKEEQALKKGGFFGCEKCIPLRIKRIYQTGLGEETQADKFRYAEYVVPHILPETKKRRAELEKEMVARVAWEKEN